MFRTEQFMGRRVIKSSLLDGEDVSAFFTTRDLPLKTGEREDFAVKVEQNKELVCEGLGIDLKNLFIPLQTHSDNVETVKSIKIAGEVEALSSFDFPLENTDALISNLPKVALALNFADCVPIIFYDPIKKAVGCAHAGWRGTVAKIGVKTVQKMIDEFGCETENIIALIGPAIGECCFEVGEDVKKSLLASVGVCQNKQEDLKISNLKSSNVDLKQINKLQLLAMGLKKIDVCEYCTSCQNELFFSYRKEKGNTARHSAVICLK